MSTVALPANNLLNAFLVMSAPARETQAGKSFVSVMDTFEEPAPDLANLVPATPSTSNSTSNSTSQQIADALIRSMLSGPAIYRDTQPSAQNIPAALTQKRTMPQQQNAAANRDAKESINNNDKSGAEQQETAPQSAPVRAKAAAAAPVEPNETQPQLSTQVVAAPVVIAPAAPQIPVEPVEPAAKDEVQNDNKKDASSPEPATPPQTTSPASEPRAAAARAASTTSAPRVILQSAVSIAPAPVTPQVQPRAAVAVHKQAAQPAVAPVRGAAQPIPQQPSSTQNTSTLTSPALVAAPAPVAAPVDSESQAPVITSEPAPAPPISTPAPRSQKRATPSEPLPSSRQNLSEPPAPPIHTAKPAIITAPAPLPDTSSKTAQPTSAANPSSDATTPASTTSGDDSSTTPALAVSTAAPNPLPIFTALAATRMERSAASRFAPVISQAAADKSTSSTNAPVAFFARLRPLDLSFPPVTPPDPSEAAEEMPMKSVSPAATFSDQPEDRQPLPAPSQTPVEDSKPVTAKKTDSPQDSASPAPAKPREESHDNSASSAPPAAATAPAPAEAVHATDAAMPMTPVAVDKPAAANSAAPQSTPPSDAAQTLRSSEPQVDAPAPASNTPVQEIAVRIQQPDAAPVDLHVSERGGEIHVSVRTADGAMQTSLRQDLGTLSNSLERAGYRSEMYTPREGAAPAAHETAPQNSNSQRDDREQPGQGNRGGSQNQQNGRQQQSQKDQRQKIWLEELENSK